MANLDDRVFYLWVAGDEPGADGASHRGGQEKRQPGQSTGRAARAAAERAVAGARGGSRAIRRQAVSVRAYVCVCVYECGCTPA
eukprot:scaffold218684_cov26-Tisochrysis_lutea.AAC.1